MIENIIFNVAFWLRKKFQKATQRRYETQGILRNLLGKPNPHQPGGQNFTVVFFKRQWRAQREFHVSHSETKTDRRKKLVALYKRKATVEHMRQGLQSPEIFFVTVAEVRALMDSIVTESDSLSIQIAQLTGRNYEEEKLRLLLWDAKSDLFAQVVQIHAERRPLLDSHIMGSHLGTHGKETIVKALQNRRPAVKKIIDSFNELYQEFREKYPNHQQPDVHNHPLTYKVFIQWEMDHAFWNDGLYYHTNAPWSIDTDVCEGINCILVLGRIQEEFEMLAQELSRTIGWARRKYSKIKETIDYITRRIEVMKSNPNVAPDQFDELSLGLLTRLGKLELIREELKLNLIDHGELIKLWSNDISWLWQRCQPDSNNSQFQEWTRLIDQVKRDRHTFFPNILSNDLASNDVDDDLEEAVLDVLQDDGEDVQEELMTDV
ncbi:hypothetical protein PtB15_1B230 [Puccinia triticina]|nr:hypothetical protein PtB15_1B230 [Puccinia triticina]